MSLIAESLTLAYRGREVLRDVSLDIAPGEFVAIVGPNASGKSTLMRAVGRAHRPQAGRVTLDGDDLYRLPRREVARLLAFLPQLVETEIDLTVEELACRTSGCSAPQQSEMRGWSRTRSALPTAGRCAPGP